MPYWTPAGIVMAEPPPAYAAVMPVAQAGTSWNDAMREHGYKPNGTIGQEYHLIEVAIWQHCA